MATKKFDKLANFILNEAYDLISPTNDKSFDDNDDELETVAAVESSPDTQEQMRRKMFSNGFKRDSAGNFILKSKNIKLEFEDGVVKDIDFQLVKNTHEQYSFKIIIGTNEPIETTIASVNNDKEASTLFDNIAATENDFLEHFLNDLDLRASVQFLSFIELLEKKDKENVEKEKKEEAEKDNWKNDMELPTEDSLTKEEPKEPKSLATISKEKEEEAKLKKTQLK